MIEIFILLTFLIVVSYLFLKDYRERNRVDGMMKVLESTLFEIFSSVENTQDKFYEMAARIETEHFKQLEKQSDKQNVMFANQLDKLLKLLETKPKEVVVDKISGLDSDTQNSIEKDDGMGNVNPLQDFDPSMIRNVKNIQFEGEEEIYPITNE